MSRAERAIRDMGKLYGAELGAGAFALVFSAWLATNLPSGEYALLPVCIMLAALVEVFACFGMGNLFVRLIPSLLQSDEREKAAALLRVGLAINVLAASLLTTLLLLGTEEIVSLLHLQGQVEVSVVRLLTAAVLFTAMYKLLERALYAVQEFGKAAFIRLIMRVIRSPLAVGLYVLMGINGAVLALSFASFIATALAVIWLWPYAAVWGYPHQPKHVISQALPFYGASLANLSTSRLDLLIMGVLTTPTMLAGYHIARLFADYLRQLGTSAIEAITPKLAEQHGQANREREHAFTRCWRYLFLGMLPLHVGLAVTAGPIVALFAGDKYPAAGLILSVMALGLFVDTLASLYRAHVMVFARQWHLMLLDGSAGVVSIGLSVVLVLYLGGLGAALAQVAQFVVRMLLAIVLLKQVLILRYDKQATWAAVSGSVLVASTGLILTPLIPGPWSIPVIVVAGIGIYFLALGRKLTQNDMDLVWRLMPSRLLAARSGAWFMRGIARFLCEPSTTTSEAK